ncbi:MAG TPA: hypothetical protein ENJ82_04425, partial [Bacteroidetes bacterium]|nr:hypothetical protein [Bacteroidota bacterium]
MNKDTISAVAIDTAGIQRYVFASNKLKENIGASYIIEELLYKKLMLSCIKDAAIKLNAWEDQPDKIALLAARTRLAEVGYIGGGNCMLL